jgi:hypothetical protein
MGIIAQSSRRQSHVGRNAEINTANCRRGSPIGGWGNFVAVWVMLLASSSVHLAEAHGDHQWIANGDLHDPVSGQWCCGDNDCHVVDDAAVIYVGKGYYVRERNDSGFEFIEEQRALPLSPDGRIHRCVEHGYVDDAVYTRCFIVPPKTM